MVGCVEAGGVRQVRSHHALKANGSMVSSQIQLSVLQLGPLRADVHCPVVETTLTHLKDAILDDQEGIVKDCRLPTS